MRYSGNDVVSQYNEAVFNDSWKFINRTCLVQLNSLSLDSPVVSLTLSKVSSNLS